MAGSSKKFVVGIDIGSSMTRVVVAEESQKLGAPPRVAGIGYAMTRGIRHGYVISAREASESVTEAIQMAEKTTGIEIKRAYVALGGIGLSSEIGGGATSIARPDGEVTEEDLHNVMQIAREAYGAHKKNKRILHAIPMKYRLDGMEVMGNPIGMRGSRIETRVVFVTVLEHHFNDLVSAVTQSGVDVIDVVASPIAESLATLTKRQKMVGCGLLNVGSETVSLAVFDGDIPVSLGIFPIGSSDVTNDIALGLRISLDDAEQVKMGKIEDRSFSRKRIDEIVHARLSDIFELVQQHLKSIKRDGLLPAGIIISGGGGMLEGIEDFTKDYLKLPAAVMQVGTIMNTRKDLDTSWLVAYGLCFLEDDDQVYGPKIFQQMLKESKKGIMKVLREFLP